MKKYIILGHCNIALSMILESIQRLNKEESSSISIINNEDDVFDLYYGNSYKPYKNMNINEIEVKNFQPLSIMNASVLIAAMDTERRQQVFNFYSENCHIHPSQYGFIFHPSTVVASTAEIGNGCYFGPNVSIAPFAKIGQFVYINRNASVGHHTTLSSFTTLNPGCTIGGNTSIGANVVIGMGANIFDNLVIGENVTIGAGAVVTKNIPSNTVAYGVPAKVIKNKDLKS